MTKKPELLPIGTRVVCVDASHSFLVEGQEYVIRGHNCGDYFVEGITPSWNPRRFKKADETPPKLGPVCALRGPRSTQLTVTTKDGSTKHCTSPKVACSYKDSAEMPLKVGDQVLCTDGRLSNELLKRGCTYWVVGVSKYGGFVAVSDNRRPVGSTPTSVSWWAVRRFEKTQFVEPELGTTYKLSVTAKTGEPALKCKLTAGGCSGQVNVPPAGTVCGERIDCPYKEKLVAPAASDLDQLQALLRKGGASLRSWRIGSYVDRDGNDVRTDGWVLVHGSPEDNGPYTQYLFDATGALLPNGVSTICFDNGVLKETR